ncbi:hypothetical protein P3S68_011426 [Capsicum galapagoense]
MQQTIGLLSSSSFQSCKFLLKLKSPKLSCILRVGLSSLLVRDSVNVRKST